jgi:hypothetical protein
VVVQELDQCVERGGDVVRFQDGHLAREPHSERIGDVGTGPSAQAAVARVLVVEGGGDERGVHLDAATPRPDVELLQEPAPGLGIPLIISGGEDETHPAHCVRSLHPFAHRVLGVHPTR